MPQRGRPPADRGVFSFQASDWTAPQALLLDTSVAVDALLPPTNREQDSGLPVRRLNLRVASMMLAGALARVLDDDGAPVFQSVISRCNRFSVFGRLGMLMRDRHDPPRPRSATSWPRSRALISPRPRP